MFPLLLIILALLPKKLPALRGVIWSYIVLEAFDVADWFLRYGQDILTKGFDANVIKITGITVSIACFITYYITNENDR